MPFTAKLLAEGQVASSMGALFTATALTYVKKVHVGNTDAVEQEVILYITRGTPRYLQRFILEQWETGDVTEDGESLILESGDSIEGVTTTGSVVDYFVTGVEQT